MTRRASCALLLFLTPWVVSAAEPPRRTARELVDEGVRLQEAGKRGEAVERYKQALALEPANASAYYQLGTAAADARDATAGIFYLLRFISLQPDEPRVAKASAKVFELLTQGVSTEGGGGVKVTLNADVLEQDSGELGAIELGRMIAAALIHGEEAESQTKAGRYVSALDSFVKIADETTQDGDLRDTFVWKSAAAPIVDLEHRGLLECLGYFVAEKAGFEGAADWLKKNPQKWQDLQTALAAQRG